MFLLRCAFWLSVMYASVSWGAGALRDPRAFSAAAAGELQVAGEAAVAQATDWCAERPTRCARDAARLTALVETTSAADLSTDDAAFASEAAAPMPVPDPRRRVAHAVLTDER